MTNTLTLETLVSKGACSEAQEKFARIFPNGAPLTVETFVNVAGEFNWDCAAKLLLTDRNQVKFNAAMDVSCDTDSTARNAAAAAYKAARDTYDAACDACDAALVTYNSAYAARATALVTLNAARDAYNSACDACDAALVTYNADYAAYAAARDAAFATAFATLYIHQESQTS